MSKFLTAPQWYDAGGGLNKSLDVNTHSAEGSVAFGSGADAEGLGTAVGFEAHAPIGSVALGYKAKNTGINGVAIGDSATCKDGNGVAIGQGSYSHAEDTIAIGNYATTYVDNVPYRRVQFLRRNVDTLGSQIGFGKNTLLDLIYPIGSIYISVSSTNPGTIFGGTWEAFATGKTLVGVDAADTDFNAAGNEGGSKTVTLTKDQMPAHTHTLMRSKTGGQTYTGTVFDSVDGPYEDVSTLSAGGSQPHDNMPPYITVYMWKRTA